MQPFFEVRDMNIGLKRDGRLFPAVEHVSLALEAGKTLGIIGESGSGKSLTCMAMQGLLDEKLWQVSGSICIDGREIALTDKRQIAALRGNELAMIMQNPMSAFNPVITIEKHFLETVNKKGRPKQTKAQVHAGACELLRRMHIQDPEAVLRSYAFQLSGGMLQRIMIALAVAVQPRLLIADEPTTALDLSVQREILKILKEIQQTSGTSILIVSHDLSVIEYLADDIRVMYAGAFIEGGEKQQILSDPHHPYSRGLFRSRPAFSKERLQVMEGQPPTLFERREGCRFYDRCSERTAICENYRPDYSHHSGDGDRPEAGPAGLRQVLCVKEDAHGAS